MITLFVGDTGTEITLDCETDVSDLSSCSIIAKKSTGAKMTWPGQLSGTNAISYATQVGDINIPGLWQLQAHVVTPSGSWFGTIVPMTVLSPL